MPPTFDLRLFYGLSSHKMTIAHSMRDSVMKGLQLKGILVYEIEDTTHIYKFSSRTQFII